MHYKKLFSSIKDYKTLIIDISNCMGGDMRSVRGIICYLKKGEYVTVDNKKTISEHKEEFFGGNVIVIVSNKSESAAPVFAGLIKYNNIGMIIGEEMGGNSIMYGYNDFQATTVPNISIPLRISNYKGIIPTIGETKNLSVDILLEDEIPNYKGIDLLEKEIDIYDKIMEIVEKKNK